MKIDEEKWSTYKFQFKVVQILIRQSNIYINATDP
jgi:hypothetical protein